MLKNSKMREVARLLGVELGERFRTKNTHNDCGWWFDEKRIHCKKKGVIITKPVENLQCAITLFNLLHGIDSIRRVPWRPYDGDGYFFVDWGKEPGIFVFHSHWKGCAYDYLLLRARNCFKTEDEADRNKYDMYEKYTGKRHPDDKRVY